MPDVLRADTGLAWQAGKAETIRSHLAVAPALIYFDSLLLPPHAHAYAWTRCWLSHDAVPPATLLCLP